MPPGRGAEDDGSRQSSACHRLTPRLLGSIPSLHTFPPSATQIDVMMATDSMSRVLQAIHFGEPCEPACSRPSACPASSLPPCLPPQRCLPYARQFSLAAVSTPAPRLSAPLLTPASHATGPNGSKLEVTTAEPNGIPYSGGFHTFGVTWTRQSITSTSSALGGREAGGPRRQLRAAPSACGSHVACTPRARRPPHPHIPTTHPPRLPPCSPSSPSLPRSVRGRPDDRHLPQPHGRSRRLVDARRRRGARAVGRAL